jgi:periplasmic divalent cation tolerance protein
LRRADEMGRRLKGKSSLILKRYIAVFITASSREEAVKIAEKLLAARLAACVNILEGVESRFWWEGRLDHGREVLLVVKSAAYLMEKIIKSVKETHSYQVPEIIALPIIAGNKDYLKWIDESLRQPS